MSSATAPSMTKQTNAALSNEWRELLVDAAGGDSSLAALTSARLLLAAPNGPTLEDTQVAIQRFFNLERKQATEVMTRLAADAAHAQKGSQQAA